MRSLTFKLILAFLVTSLLSIAVIVALSRFATNREFNRFVSDQYKSELSDRLAIYYEEHGTWEGVGLTALQYPGPGEGQSGPNGNPLPFFSVADANGFIVSETFQHEIAESVDEKLLAESTPIEVNGETIGYLILETPPERKDPRQAEFLKRLDLSLLFSAIGTVVLALVFGAILSRNITNPIRELTSATHAMADGRLGQKVTVRSKDEIGELASSFNKMNDDLARSFNLRKQMTADIAHELRTPLSLIIGHAEAVHDGVLPPSRENFEIIREEANRLEQLVNDLRTLSLADAGELTLNLQSVDINKLLGDIQTLYLHQFNQKRVALNLEAAPVILNATLDPTRIAQVLTNILDNALRYTPEKGRVVIKTSQINNMIDIIVQDSGIGVNPKEAQHLFDRFYRSDASRARDAGGSGLGLAIAKSIIEMHNGKIWAESEKGKGLRVIIQLPVSK